MCASKKTVGMVERERVRGGERRERGKGEVGEVGGLYRIHSR